MDFRYLIRRGLVDKPTPFGEAKQKNKLKKLVNILARSGLMHIFCNFFFVALLASTSVITVFNQLGSNAQIVPFWGHALLTLQPQGIIHPPIRLKILDPPLER